MHQLDNLLIWKKAMGLTKDVYGFLSNLPENEKYGLTAQIRRSAIYIPSNIAEGAGRNSDREFKQFLGISNGSTFELQTQLLLVKELEMCPMQDIEPIINTCIEQQKMNFSLQKTLIKKMENP
jgi:four helix bundle protein